MSRLHGTFEFSSPLVWDTLRLLGKCSLPLTADHQHTEKATESALPTPWRHEGNGHRGAMSGDQRRL